MREILFRGLRVNGIGFVYGSLLNINEERFIYPHETGDLDDLDFDGSFVQVEPKTVGQYTGLKDKNGVKIFWGDTGKQEAFFQEDFDPYGDRETFHIMTRGEVRIHPSRGVVICNVEMKDMDIENGEWEKRSTKNLRASRFEVTGNIHEVKPLIP